MTQLDTIKEFIKLLVIDFELEEDELLEVWTRVHPEPTSETIDIEPSSDTPPTSLTDADEALLKRLKRDDLVKLCEERSLAKGGTKAVLIDRLLSRATTTKSKKSKKSGKKPKVRDNVPPMLDIYEDKENKFVLERLLNTRPVLEIFRNDFGNYEDKQTKFIFDPVSEMVIGKQGNDEKILPLNADDIHRCQELNYRYILPPNLNIS